MGHSLKSHLFLVESRIADAARGDVQARAGSEDRGGEGPQPVRAIPMTSTAMNNPRRSGIIGWFANNPVAANLLMLLVIVMGLISVGDLRKEAFPSGEPDKISITVSYDSGSARRAPPARPAYGALPGSPG